MLPVPEFILYLTKDSKTHKIHCFFFKNWVRLFISINFFFSLNNAKKKLYANVLEILKFNPKTNIRKYPILCNRYKVFSASVSDFYSYFTAKN